MMNDKTPASWPFEDRIIIIIVLLSFNFSLISITIIKGLQPISYPSYSFFLTLYFALILQGWETASKPLWSRPELFPLKFGFYLKIFAVRRQQLQCKSLITLSSKKIWFYIWNYLSKLIRALLRSKQAYRSLSVMIHHKNISRRLMGTAEFWLHGIE